MAYAEPGLVLSPAIITPLPASAPAEGWFSRNLDLALMLVGGIVWAAWKQRGAGLALIAAGLLVRLRDDGRKQIDQYTPMY